MTIAYFDCFAGAAGDMIVGALLDAGADFDQLQAQLARLGLDEYTLRCEIVRRGGLGGVKFHVDLEVNDQGHEHGHPHRRLSDILAIIERSTLSPAVKKRASDIFRKLGEAESKVHRIDIEEVHFHEVGAVDSIIDIVGACVAMELLGVERVCCSAIPTGSGTIRCEHGLLPAPSPATAALLEGIPLALSPLTGEVTTPTAAAVLTTLAASYGPLPAMRIRATGYGAGSRDGDAIPNLLRVFIGDEDESTADTVVELSANIDDATGEVLGDAIVQLLEMGCLDAWASPIYMKKNRPAWMLSALCELSDVEHAEELIFKHTTTFGVRRSLCTRAKLDRRHEVVETAYGPLRIKIGSRGGKIVTAAPEFSDCLQAARSHNVSVRTVLQTAATAFETRNGHDV